MYSNGKNTAYSGQGQLVSNLVTFAAFLILFVGSLYSLSFWTLENAWIPGLVTLALATATFLIPQNIMGRTDTADEVLGNGKGRH